MKLSIQAGATSQTINVFIRDSSSTTGGGLTGLVFNSAGLTAYYALPRAAAAAITLATLAAVTSAFSSGGFKEIDATNMPGWYRFDIPDAALASGRFVSIHLKGAANMAPTPIEIELTGWNNQDAVRGGMTALPNANAAANGGLPTVNGSNYIAGVQGTINNLNNLDAAITTRLAAASYTAPDNTGISNAATDAATAAAAATSASSSAATAATNTGTLLARIGAFTGTGVNTVLGFFKALLSKTATLPSDVGGTFDPTMHSTEAIRDQGDAAWTTATGFSTLDAAGVRTAVGLASADLDTQLAALPTAAENAAAVWDEALAGHATAGSAGAALSTAGSGASAATIADAVWDEALAGHLTAGSTGEALNGAGGGGSAPTADENATAVWQRLNTIGVYTPQEVLRHWWGMISGDYVKDSNTGITTVTDPDGVDRATVTAPSAGSRTLSNINVGP